MNRYTISLGTCENGDGKLKSIYVLHPSILEDEYCKQKAGFNNPNATDESIERIARQIVYAEVVQRLGEYEELWEIIKNKDVNIQGMRELFSHNHTTYEEYLKYWNRDTDYCIRNENKHFGYSFIKLTETEFNLIKEWLENE